MSVSRGPLKSPISRKRDIGAPSPNLRLSVLNLIVGTTSSPVRWPTRFRGPRRGRRVRLRPRSLGNQSRFQRERSRDTLRTVVLDANKGNVTDDASSLAIRAN